MKSGKDPLSHIRAWGAGKGWGFRALALTSASLVEPLFAAFEAIRKGSAAWKDAYRDRLAAFPGLEAWDRYYRHPAELLRDGGRAILTGLGCGQKERDRLLTFLTGRPDDLAWMHALLLLLRLAPPEKIDAKLLEFGCGREDYFRFMQLCLERPDEPETEETLRRLFLQIPAGKLNGILELFGGGQTERDRFLARLARYPETPELDAAYEEFMASVPKEKQAEAGETILRQICSFLLDCLLKLDPLLAGLNMPEPRGGLATFCGEPSGKFLARVFLPCLAEYQTLPGALLARASAGDEESLRRLLALDKHALHLREVAEISNRRLYSEPGRWHATVAKYLALPFPKINRRKLKFGIGAFIKFQFPRLSEAFANTSPPALAGEIRAANQFSQPETQGLFSALEWDSGRLGYPREDPDIADYDAYRQGVHRLKSLSAILPFPAGAETPSEGGNVTKE